MASCLSAFIENSNFLDARQAGFRSAHSTESVILAVMDELRGGADRGISQALILLDLSAAFDTVDHDLLVDRVGCAGIQGSALRWITSFLADRSQAVRLGDFSSPMRKLTCGVPQGSSLSPLLFNLYLLPLIKSLRSRNVETFNYADDLQLIFDFDHLPSSVSNFQSTLCFISSWMNSNQLKLNPDKTELILTGGSANPWNASFWPTELGTSPIPASSVKSLGILISNDLSMKAQIGAVVSSCFFQLRKLRKISRFLTTEALTLAILALVTSRIDYANSLYVGIPAYQQHRLQLVQNQAARLIARLSRRQHIQPLLKHLHWLPVNKRSAFKLGCITFNALAGKGPTYILSKIHQYKPTRALRSSHSNLLSTFSFKRERVGGLRFSVLAPKFWNSLPMEIRLTESYGEFRKLLKTYLFTQAYQ